MGLCPSRNTKNQAQTIVTLKGREDGAPRVALIPNAPEHVPKSREKKQPPVGPSAVGPHLKRVRAAQAPVTAGVEGPVPSKPLGVPLPAQLRSFSQEESDAAKEVGGALRPTALPFVAPAEQNVASLVPEWDVFLSEKQSQWKQMKTRPGPAIRQCADGTYTSQYVHLLIKEPALTAAA